MSKSSSILALSLLLSGCSFALWPFPVPRMPPPQGPTVCAIDSETKAQKCEVRE